MTKREKELEEALKPFARYGKRLKENRLMKYMDKNTPIVGLPFAPTIGEFEALAELIDVDDLDKPDINEIRKQTTGKVSVR